MKRVWFLTLGISLLLANTARCQDLLQAYIDTALQVNPDLRSVSLQRDALEKKVVPSRALDDPMLSVGVMNLPTNFSFTDDMMTMKQVGVEQSFRVGRQYRLQGAMAEKDYAVGLFDLDSRKREVSFRVKEAYFDLFAVKKAIELTRLGVATMASYAEAASARNSNGLGTQQDVLNAQTQVTMLRNSLINLEAERDRTAATFNSILNRDLTDSVAVGEELGFEPIALNMEELLVSAYQHNPDLAASQTQLSKDSVAMQLEMTTKIPAFTGGIWYGQRQARTPEGTKANDMLGFTFGISLPIYSGRKQNPLIEGSRIQVKKSQADLESTRNRITLMVHNAVVSAAQNQKILRLFSEQLIPQTAETLKAGFTAYQQNKTDFESISNEFMSLLNYRIQYYQALADYCKAKAVIEMLAGDDVTQ